MAKAKGTKGGATPQAWQPLGAAAARLGKTAGHLRRLCPAWERRGLARRVTGGGRRPRWEVRQDARLPRADGAAESVAPAPVVLTVGQTAIKISSTAAVTLHISPAGQAAAGRRSGRPSEGRSTGD